MAAGLRKADCADSLLEGREDERDRAASAAAMVFSMTRVSAKVMLASPVLGEDRCEAKAIAGS